jgi:hypothetical protein
MELIDVQPTQHSDRQHSQPLQQLVTYRPQQQHAGTFISGFDWSLYGTGSFRRLPADDEKAVFYLDRFATKLSRSMRFKKNDLAYYAALEDQTPGLGGKPVRKHCHFLVACPDHELLPSVAEQLWLENGRCKIDRYNQTLAAGYYINKLIADGAVTHERNLQLLRYTGPSDLIEATLYDSYVPDRLKNKTSGEYPGAAR